MITKITAAYVRHYSDNGQTTAYVEWINSHGKTGRTEGAADPRTRTPIGAHMTALLDRAAREGVTIEQQIW